MTGPEVWIAFGVFAVIIQVFSVRRGNYAKVKVQKELKFKVFRNGAVADNLDLSGAYLFGTDGIAVRKADIGFFDGQLVCEKQNLDTAGLVLLWPVEGFGTVLLPTTCLPRRERPYCLNVELARGKLMEIVNKSEDWAYFNSEDLGEDFEQARGLFINALNAISDMPTAAGFADEALKKAIVFADRLASAEADTMFRARAKNHGFGKGCLGFTVEAQNIKNKQYIDKLAELAGYVTIRVNWAEIERTKGEYDFSEVDKCVIALGKRRLSVGAGPLLRFEKEYIPQWLLKQKQAFENIRESAYRFVSESVMRYANRIRTWSVVSGLNCHNHFGFSFEQVLELTRAANMAVKSVDDRTRKIIEVDNPWGEYYASVAGSIPPLVYMDMVVQSGINFDAFGLSMDMDKTSPGAHMRDMMQISALLDYVSPIAKPFFIGNVCVPADTGARGDDVSARQGQWTASRQAEWLEQFYTIVLSKPFVETVIYSGLVDSGDSQAGQSGLVTKDFQPKEAFKSLKKIRQAILET